jgi:ketosteroid isomerase-like protein
MNAHVFGDAAIVQGITTVKGKSGESSFDVNVRFTDTLVRENGKWRLVVSHVTAIPD